MKNLKRKVRIIGIAFFVLLIISGTVLAADFSVRASSTTYKPGETVTVNVTFSATDILGIQANFSYDTSQLKYVSGGSSGSQILYDSNDPKNSHTVSLKFTALKDGTSNVTVSGVKIGTVAENFTVSGSKSASIKIVTPAPTTPKPTTPTTPKPTTPAPTTPVEPEVNPMDKAIEVTIGEAKWYLWPELLNVTLPSGYDKGEGKYKETTIQIAQRNQVQLAYLTDAEGKNGTFWTYNAQTQEFYPFITVQSSGSYVLLQPGADVALPEGYETETTFDLDGRSVNGWKSEDETLKDFVLVYAMNSEGNEGFYYYDVVEKTLQRFGQRIVEVEVIVEPEPEPIVRQIFGNPVLAGIFSGLGLLAAGLAAALIRTIQKNK